MGEILSMTEVPVTEHLQPCPFCGEAENLSIDDFGEHDVFVQCDSCEAIGPATRIGCRDDDDIDLEAEAIELWNSRK